MDKKQETINTYNRAANQFADKFNKLGPRIKDIEKAFSYISKPNPKVIELGCGNGRDAKEILKRTIDYTGIDASEKLIEQARRHIPEGNFEVCDFEVYKFPVNIDIIFAFASLLHANRENMKEILKKSYNALNPKGIIFLSLKYGSYKEETKSEDIGERTFYYYTPEEIKLLTSNHLINVFQEIQDINSQKWFTIVLQKES